ncbi:MAG: hypothetical protein JSS66_06705 [Armatimonadetes bacterium]|nr:hypothetical protein [Armatimonadota bacterium]
MNELRVIPASHVQAVCKPGSAETCRYFSVDMNGPACLKLDPEFKALLDTRVASGDMRAQGDNCDGWTGEDESNTVDAH